ASKGPDKAMADNVHLAAGLNVSDGKIRHQAVADAFGLPMN
ncbi:MAG: alanine dehydrogenase, partial [Parasphingopyxis sp.]